MGQYYTLACPETGTYADARTLGSFVKAYEQVWSTGMPSILAFLCSAGRGSHPRDLPWAPAGIWAGRMPLMVGDYAETGDLRGREAVMGMPEDSIYGACMGKETGLTTAPGRRKKLQSVSADFVPIFERVHGVRANDRDIEGRELSGDRLMRDFIPAKLENDAWVLDLDGVEPEHRQEVKDYYTRIGVEDDTTWARGPVRPSYGPEAAQSAPDTIPSAEAGQGGKMLWVNLDRREFVDPATLGDVPDLAGTMVGLSARAVLGMLVHNEARGGGDLGDLGPIRVAGRWRGDRIVLLGETGFKPAKGKAVTQDQVRSHFVDVSDQALAFIKCEEFFGSEHFQPEGAERQVMTEIEADLFSIACAEPAAAKIIEAGDKMEVVITPTVRISKGTGKEALPRPLILPATVDVYVDGGKVFLGEQTRALLAEMAALMEVEDTALTATPHANPNYQPKIGYDAGVTARRGLSSNHQIIAEMMRAKKSREKARAGSHAA